MMKKKHFRGILSLFFILLILLSACGGNAEAGESGAPSSQPSSNAPEPSIIVPTPDAAPPSSDVSPNASETDSPEVSVIPALDADDFPSEISIPVTLAEKEENFTGVLRVSDLGYAIYTLPGFRFMSNNSMDLIFYSDEDETVTPDVSTMPSILIAIRRIDVAAPLPEATETNGRTDQFKRIVLGDTTFDVALSYPVDVTDAPALLNAMLDTMRVE
jgi:hypothetical protein